MKAKQRQSKHTCYSCCRKGNLTGRLNNGVRGTSGELKMFSEPRPVRKPTFPQLTRTYFRVQVWEREKMRKGGGGVVRFDVLFVLLGKMEDIHCPLLPKDPQCNSNPQWSHGECAPGVTWSDGSHQFTTGKTENKKTKKRERKQYSFVFFWPLMAHRYVLLCE